MRVAIIGSGISGLVCARLLSANHQVTLFESDSKLGGHVNTIDVPEDDRVLHIDTGFIVYNERTYPNFTRILNDLQVSTHPTAMSFSVNCDRTGLQYNGTSLNGLFAQRRNLLRPSFWWMIRDILRFNRQGADDVDTVAETMTVGEYLSERGYSPQFANQYLLPMGAAIWSCPRNQFAQFPIKFILQFYLNHGLLSLRDRPTWRVVDGGSRSYVEKLSAPFLRRVRLNCPVNCVTRNEDLVQVRYLGGEDYFDEVVFACHSDQALRILADADPVELEVLKAFPYSLNTAVLHTDETLLPSCRRAWACWNYHISEDEEIRPSLTYNMNLLQHLDSSKTYCVTLNDDQSIDPSKEIARFNYSHPLFTTNRSSMQLRHWQMIRRRNTSFCGAYWRNGFHEDGVVSALAVCRKFGIQDWTPRTESLKSVSSATFEGAQA
ncbi:MAG: FAD-dependent oxidoreductase [Planctomycetales bacterium]|nr:FAD-dependent oxidoreductase [Planctomycetales bacterium]